MFMEICDGIVHCFCSLMWKPLVDLENDKFHIFGFLLDLLEQK